MSSEERIDCIDMMGVGGFIGADVRAIPKIKIDFPFDRQVCNPIS